MKKQIPLVLATAACALGTGAAHAGTVFWSIGISAPVVGTVISNAPAYYPQPAPAYYPEPAYYYPAPVYVTPPRVVYRPPVVIAPRPYHGSPQVVYGGWNRVAYPVPQYRHDGRDDRRDGRSANRRDHDGRAGKWAPVPTEPRRSRP